MAESGETAVLTPQAVEQVSSKPAPVEILGRIREEMARESDFHPLDARAVLKDVSLLAKTSVIKDKAVCNALDLLGRKPPIPQTVVECLREAHQSHDLTELRRYLWVAKALGLRKVPEIKKVCDLLAKTLEPPKAKSRLPKGAKFALAGAAGVFGVGAAAPYAAPIALDVLDAFSHGPNPIVEDYKIVSNLPDLPIPFEEGELESQTGANFVADGSLVANLEPGVAGANGESRVQPASEVKPEFSQSVKVEFSSPATNPPKEASPQKEVKKRNFFKEVLMEPIFQDAMRRRAERLEVDKGYKNRIDWKLNEDRVNMVFLGIGSENSLTDSIVVLSWEKNDNTGLMISSPRDIASPEGARKAGQVNIRVNKDYALGGLPLARETMENMTRLSADYVFVVKFDFLTEFVDQIAGGIDFDLETSIHDDEYPDENEWYEPFYMEKGHHEGVDGKTALKLARSRHGSTDYARAKRAQQVIRAIGQGVAKKNDPISLLRKVNEFLQRKADQGSFKGDADIRKLLIASLQNLETSSLGIVGEQLLGQGWELGLPEIEGVVFDPSNIVVNAGIPSDPYLTKVRGGDIRGDPLKYWQPAADLVAKAAKLQAEKVKLKNAAEPQRETEEVIQRHGEILRPAELNPEEYKKWIGKMRNNHDAVVTESMFLNELAQFPESKRQEILKAIAKAHAKALVEHYGQTEAIIGLDPGHGGSEVGAGARAVDGKNLAEKDVNWDLTSMIAEELLRESGNRYTVVILRPQNPKDEDWDKDGVISPFDRHAKRVALFIKEMTEHRLTKGGYVAVHLNGEGSQTAKGAETYYPNDIGASDQAVRESSARLAKLLQDSIVKAIRDAGYNIADRGVKEDPDRRSTQSNAEQVGPYIWWSPKLDRPLS